MDRLRGLQQSLTFVGAFVFTLPCGLPLYVGNLAVYCISYTTVTLGVENPSFGPWVLSIFNLAKAAGTLLAGFLSEYIGNRSTMIFGSFIFSSGFLLCYYTVQKSFVLLMITLALLPGIGSGVTRLMSLSILLSWSKNNTGILTAIVPTAFGIGAIILNQFLTFYINPKNDEANGSVDSSKYFDQPEIIEKVPSVFICLGSFSMAVMLTGCLLMKENSNEFQSGQEADKEKSCEETEKFLSSRDSEEGSIQSTSDESSMCEICKDDFDDEEKAQTKSIKNTEKNVHPKAMLKDYVFYVLVFLFLTAKQGEMVFYTYYKSYGQIWIKDDHFLTNLGTVISFMAVVTRPLCGIAIDRLGIKSVTVFLFSLTGLLIVWLYHSVFLHRWLYFVLCTIVSIGQSSFSIIYACLLTEYFGKLHFAVNYGVYLSIGSLLNFVTPPFVDLILLNFGWFKLFAYVGILSIISVLLSIFLLPGKK